MLLVDTNVWLAAADRRAREHVACVDLLARRRNELTSTALVVAETAWLLLDREGPGAQRDFLAMIANREVDVVDLLTVDWERIVELVDRYADLELDVVDASTVAVAERLRQIEIATLDHRDFAVVRPTHIEAFVLLP